MAYVVRRPAGRWEVRESVTTAKGPRARSLASFRTLDDGVLDRAERAARTGFDRAAVAAAARRAGAPVEEATVDRLARALLAELGRGRRPKPGLAAVLADRLRGHGVPAERLDDTEAIALSMGASDADRGRSVRDLVELGDSFPLRSRGRLRYPPLRSFVRG